MTAEEILEKVFEIHDGSITFEQAKSILKQTQSEAIAKTVKMAVEIVLDLVMKCHIENGDGDLIIALMNDKLTPERVMGEK